MADDERNTVIVMIDRDDAGVCLEEGKGVTVASLIVND